jgi:RNA ligase (TIGR02306 family)
MRKLATIRTIEALDPIPNADAIELATVGGWKVVAQKGLYKVGDLAVYFEIDSWMPTKLAPFLSKGKEPRVFEGIQGERLRTIKLRGQLSQGLLIPLRECEGEDYTFDAFEEGYDVTELLGVVKWEKPINAQLAGVCKGNFPTLIPKTDQERVQNIKKELLAVHCDLFEVTEKLEGSSMTVYRIDGEFGVCSRNMDLKRDENNSFWKTAVFLDIENKMIALEMDNVAIQGELIGPGIQGNIYGLSQPEFHVFDIYSIKDGEYVTPQHRWDVVAKLGLSHVPVLDDMFVMTDSIDELLNLAEGVSRLANVEREGLVFKQLDGGMTFKAISNKYLLGEK